MTADTAPPVGAATVAAPYRTRIDGPAGPSTAGERGSRLDRWVCRATGWLDQRQFEAVRRRAGSDFTRSGWAPARIVTMLASALLLAAVLAVAAAGVWLVRYEFPQLTILPGAALLLVAFALRPRFDRLDPAAEPLDPGDHPALFGLIRQVARAIGAPMPQVVAVDPQFGAYAGAIGLRRRRTLCLGLPLWAALPPEQRVALLGHELGHFVNGDVRRGLFTQPAFTTLAVAADLVRPVREYAGLNLLTRPSEVLAFAVQWVLSRMFGLAHLALVVIGLRDTRRAEYLADRLAARAAGPDAVAGLFDSMLLLRRIADAVRRCARAGDGPGRWRAVADAVRAESGPALPRMRAASRSTANVFDAHPPVALRARMLDAAPVRPPAVPLCERDSAAIDADLLRYYERVRREIGWSDGTGSPTSPGMSTFERRIRLREQVRYDSYDPGL